MSEKKLCPNVIRNCDFKVSCCREIICCLLCHKQQVTHDVSRQSVSHIVCKSCKKECLRSEASDTCSQCSTPFATYVCIECLVFDSTKEIFHCSECKKCKLGKQSNFLHCSKCNFCISNERPTKTHICFENNTECPICLQELKDSPLAIMQFDCGHFMHVDCWQDTISTCPVCRATIADLVVDTSSIFRHQPPTPRRSWIAVLRRTSTVVVVGMVVFVAYRWLAKKSPLLIFLHLKNQK